MALSDFLSICRNYLFFYVNSKPVKIYDPDPEINLLYFLRKTLRLTGAKQSCNKGGCGACTVMISKYDPIKDQIIHFTVVACLVSLCSLDGMAITTVEGIGSTRKKVHPCQESIGRCHGTQCGFCTPGMVMSMYTLLKNNPQPTEQEMEASLRGNLCRCTGYRSILDSFRPFCESCTCKTSQQNKIELSQSKYTDATIDATQEPIFPPELKVFSSVNSSPVHIKGPRVTWYQPVTLDQLLLLREMFPQNETNTHVIVAGNTHIQHCQVANVDHPDVLISVNGIHKLKEISFTDDGLVVGAAVTLSELEQQLTESIKCVAADCSRARGFKVMLEMLSVFGSPQIRNAATIGGVVVLNSNSSDVTPVLIALHARVVIASTSNFREAPLTVLDKVNPLLRPGEVVVSVCIPYLTKNEYISFYKQSRRKYMDQAIINSCMCVRMEGSIARNINIIFGNMSNDGLVMANMTMNSVMDKEWNSDTFDNAVKTLSEEMALQCNVEGGMATYRTSLCLSFFFKFFLYIKREVSIISDEELSALRPLLCGHSQGSQGFQSISHQPPRDSIGRPLMHLSSIEQATGEAKYVDDIPATEGELFAGFVLSSCAHARFTVNTSPLDSLQGIRAFVSAVDVPGSNITGGDNDEYLFAVDEVTAVGQVIGIVVAEDKLAAQRGARSVKVTYSQLPAILTIEEAVSANQFFKPKRMECGNVDDVFNTAEHILEGEIRVGGQEHYYMETCSCLCVPKGEKGEMEIISSTQNLFGVQKYASKALNIPANKIVSKVKRLGGAFGGKQSRCDFPYSAVAVAAHKVQAPVRAVFERDEDMMNTGGRSPFKALYKVAFDSKGIVEALDIDIYSNAGYSSDLSVNVTTVVLLRIQGAYNIPNIRATGHTCRTNLPSCTGMRGFGQPQSHMIVETIISSIADTLGMEITQVQEANLMKDGDMMILGHKLEDCTIKRCWNTLKEKCEYEKKKDSVQEFNRYNKWKKRGIALVPTVQGVGIEAIHCNQAGALVHVYTDGSVLLTHGGVEMGQGLHTKMVQVCSKYLSIPMERIHLNITSTDKVPNATNTSASTSTDVYGMAVKNACDQINERLKPFKDADPHAEWDDWVIQAYLSRVNLSAQGFYSIPDIWMDWKKGIGQPYAYYSYGVGCSVVEVDTLTGGFQVLSTDLLMDAGNSLNPTIDIGQIEGAFIQGLGFFTMEEHIYLSDGTLYSDGPSLYKIPGCSDIPTELNVTLLDRCPNPNGIFSSKSVAEPPLFLAASVFFAIKDAIKHARIDRGVTESFDLWPPSTAEHIRLLCEDQFVHLARNTCI